MRTQIWSEAGYVPPGVMQIVEGVPAVENILHDQDVPVADGFARVHQNADDSCEAQQQRGHHENRCDVFKCAGQSASRVPAPASQSRSQWTWWRQFLPDARSRTDADSARELLTHFDNVHLFPEPVATSRTWMSSADTISFKENSFMSRNLLMFGMLHYIRE